MYRALILYTVTLWVCIVIVHTVPLHAWRIHWSVCIHCTVYTVFSNGHATGTGASASASAPVLRHRHRHRHRCIGIGTCPIVAAPIGGGVTLTLSFLRGAPFINPGTSAYKPRYQCIAPGTVRQTPVQCAYPRYSEHLPVPV